MPECKYINKNGTCGLKGCYAYRHKCYTEDCCRCFEKPTNADRIRGMSDEELAVFFAKVDAALYRADLDVIAYRGEKVNENLDWLRQPAEEVHDGEK